MLLYMLLHCVPCCYICCYIVYRAVTLCTMMLHNAVTLCTMLLHCVTLCTMLLHYAVTLCTVLLHCVTLCTVRSHCVVVLCDRARPTAQQETPPVVVSNSTSWRTKLAPLSPAPWRTSSRGYAALSSPPSTISQSLNCFHFAVSSFQTSSLSSFPIWTPTACVCVCVFVCVCVCVCVLSVSLSSLGIWGWPISARKGSFNSIIDRVLWYNLPLSRRTGQTMTCQYTSQLFSSCFFLISQASNSGCFIKCGFVVNNSQ